MRSRAHLLRTERPFLVAVALGVLLRALVQLAFPPAFLFSDGPTYLYFTHHLTPSPDRPIGYGMLLWAVSPVTTAVYAVAVLQALMGLAAAVVIYVLLRRWSVRPWLATVATLPLLLDQMQLSLEHTVLSDVLFELLLVLAVAALAWRRTPPLRAVALGGLLLGLVTLVRVVGEPTLLAAGIFCLVVAGSLGVRLRRVLVLAVCFALPVTAYAAWYHQAHGVWALTEASGRALYMRTTTFVDCQKVELPDYERSLCPSEPVGHRLDPTDYGWHADETLPPLVLPQGVTQEDAQHDFAMRAIRAQPWDYARTVLRDVALGFAPVRSDFFEYDTADKWSFHKYVVDEPTERSQWAYTEYGGQQLSVHQPLAGVLDAYDEVGYVPGPLLLALMVVGVAGLFVRPRGTPESRPLIFLLLSLGFGLVLVPDLTAEFVWRYQLPLVILAPPAAALAAERLQARRRDRTSRRPVPVTPRPAAAGGPVDDLEPVPAETDRRSPADV